ncbi:flagellar protein G [Halobacteria archaeon AArc-curdl1]|uniref:Flagellar protein G n=1 Tax=Natronosalvus hydrolyticus TaxID=2979988 RepID=A0AAP3E5T3_9EURY|nr:flagellar protein G [Halobacteria archaeon AArc-curdl1]
MASESVSTLILFIAAMLLAAAIAGTLVANVNDISNSIDTQSSNVQQQLDTDIEIISDAGSDAIYDNDTGNITLLVKNTGQETLANDGTGIDVLVDGRFVSSNNFEIEVVTGEVWRRGEVAEIIIEEPLESGEHRVVVDVGGDREVFEFYVP